MQFKIKEALIQYFLSILDIFYLKLAMEMSVMIKWGPGSKIWDGYIILHYFAEYLTGMLTLGLRWYRISNLVIDLKMWGKLESNLPLCTTARMFSWAIFTFDKITCYKITDYRFQFHWGFRISWKNKKKIGWTLFLIKITFLTK